MVTYFTYRIYKFCSNIFFYLVVFIFGALKPQIFLILKVNILLLILKVKTKSFACCLSQNEFFLMLCPRFLINWYIYHIQYLSVVFCSYDNIPVFYSEIYSISIQGYHYLKVIFVSAKEKSISYLQCIIKYLKILRYKV